MKILYYYNTCIPYTVHFGAMIGLFKWKFKTSTILVGFLKVHFVDKLLMFVRLDFLILTSLLFKLVGLTLSPLAHMLIKRLLIICFVLIRL